MAGDVTRHAALIRESRAADHAGLRALYRDVWPATYAATLGAAAVAAMLDDLTESDLRCMLPGEDERAAVAISGGGGRENLVGSAIVAERAGVGYLWGMYVHPRWQRRGIGAALLGCAAGWIAETTRLEARVLPSSAGAIAFYQRRGFALTGREPLEIAPGRCIDALVFSVVRRDLAFDGGRGGRGCTAPPPPLNEAGPGA